MENPFDNESTSYCVLINDEGQYSLWLASARIPAGWHLDFGPAGRQQCLDYVELNWTDMRPKSLIAAMADAKRQ